MIPKRIAGATHNFGRPYGWNAERDGDVFALAVRTVAHGGTVRCESAWEPTPDELAILRAGGLVILSVVGSQPPIMLSAEPLAGDDQPKPQAAPKDLRVAIAALARQFEATAYQKYQLRDASSTIDQGRRRDRLEAAGNAWTDAAKRIREILAQ